MSREKHAESVWAKLKCLNDRNQIIEVKVTDVLYVQLEGNLLSVKRLTEKDLQVKFESDKCYITKDGKIIAVADESSNLYKLQVSQQACVAIQKHNKYCQHMWHKRFGHRDPEAIKQLANNGLAVELKITDCGIRTTCKACIKEKMAKNLFQRNQKAELHRCWILFIQIYVGQCKLRRLEENDIFLPS